MIVVPLALLGANSASSANSCHEDERGEADPTRCFDFLRESGSECQPPIAAAMTLFKARPSARTANRSEPVPKPQFRYRCPLNSRAKSGELVVRRTSWAFAIALLCLGSLANAAGIQLLESDPALSGAIWYPCAAEPTRVALGSLSVGAAFDLEGVKDCPVTGAKLPLVVFSHGRGGWFGANHDTEEALADAGFIVAAINHPGDTTNDSSRRDTLPVWGSRPQDIVRLLDFMLKDWKDRAVIDPARVGFFGFSLGGYTGLALMGTRPDFTWLAANCKDTTGTCAQLHNGETLPDPPQDARIRAAVIVDPAPAVLTRKNVTAVKVPFQFWRSQFGGPGVGDGSPVARVAGWLEGKPDMHVVPAGHFAYLAPCTTEQATAVPRICTDTPAEFDRAGFHREFNAAVVKYFGEQLGEH